MLILLGQVSVMFILTCLIYDILPYLNVTTSTLSLKFVVLMNLFGSCHIWTILFVNLLKFILSLIFMMNISSILLTSCYCLVMDFDTDHEFVELKG